MIFLNSQNKFRVSSNLFDGRPLGTFDHFHGAYDVNSFLDVPTSSHLTKTQDMVIHKYLFETGEVVEIVTRHGIRGANGIIMHKKNVPGSTGPHLHVNVILELTNFHYPLALHPKSLQASNSLLLAIRDSNVRLSTYIFQFYEYIKSAEGIGIDKADGVYRWYGFDTQASDNIYRLYIQYLFEFAMRTYPDVIGMSRRRLSIVVDQLFNIGINAEISVKNIEAHMKYITPDRRSKLIKVIGGN